jgi:hypothetical protein
MSEEINCECVFCQVAILMSAFKLFSEIAQWLRPQFGPRLSVGPSTN